MLSLTCRMLFNVDNVTAPGWTCLVQCQWQCTRSTWAEWTGTTSSANTTLSARSVGNFINTFWFLFEASLTNSYVLYSNFSSLSRRQPLKQFRLQLAKSLIGDYHSKKRHNRHLAPPTSLSFLHFPLRRQNNDSNATLRGRCWFCWNRRQHQRRDTSWYCHECQIHLCHTGDPQTDCFMEHHK